MIPDIYKWKAQDIPEPRPNEGRLNSGIPLHAQDIIRDALTNLLENLGEDFRVAPHARSTRHDLDSGFGQIDQEIERIRSVMFAIKHDLGRRVAALCKRRNAMTPFNRLPPELFGLILSNIIPQPPTSPYESIYNPRYNVIGTLKRVVDVSTSLWRVVKSCPTLWTTIADEPNEDTALKLRYSGNLPLTIVRIYQPPSIRSNFINLVVKHSARWKSVHLELDTTEELDRIREALRGPMPYLERLELSVKETSNDGTPLDLPVDGVLRHVEALGIQLSPSTPALRSIQHLTLGSTYHVSMKDIMAALASTVVLKSVTIDSFYDFLLEARDADSTQKKLPVQLPYLVSLTIADTPSPCVVRLLDGIQANSLAYLQVDGMEDSIDEGPVMQRLLQTNGRPPILASILTLSAAVLVKIRIEDGYLLEIIGKSSCTEDGAPDPVSVKLFHDGWFDYIYNLAYFSEFVASLPSVHLHLSSSQNSISLNFLLTMPTVILIELRAYDVHCQEQLKDMLGHSHLVDGNDVWACPKLEEIRFGLAVVTDEELEELMPVLRSVLEGRKPIGPEGTLPKITIKRQISDDTDIEHDDANVEYEYITVI